MGLSEITGIKLKGANFEIETSLQLLHSNKEPALGLVYGKNGAGKSTISRAFSKLAGKQEDTIETAFAINGKAEDIILTDEDRSNIHVFNEQYVDNNIKFRPDDKGLETIVVLGRASSRRNEYTQLMINIYKYAKGENADYELVVGNSMRRVMEAYGSFMYKKGIEQLSTASEIKQKLEPPFGDHFENLMYRLVLHGGSHNEERVKSMVSDDFFDYISSEEKIRTAKEILVFLYTLDDQHVIEHLKRDLNGKTLNDVQTDLETWKQEILSLISLDE